MKVVVQRVKKASVKIEGETVGEIGQGLLVLLGVKREDTEKEASFMADKIPNLRIFADAEDKMNLSLLDVKGGVLIISQFTLYGDCKKGRRPSFVEAAQPETAKKIYEKFIEKIKKSGLKTETGKFGADMEVSLTNDGPVTLIIES